jgi:hypothetical protein
MLPFALTLRGPSEGHCVELQLFSSIINTPYEMTLRGPSGGHCVEIQLFSSIIHTPSH